MPLAPDVTVSQFTVLLAAHVHCVPEAVTPTEPFPPPEPKEFPVDESEKLHVPAACVTVTSFPPMVSVPMRDVVVPFAVTEKPTVPLPDPEAPLETEIQPVLLAAVHEHADGVVTATEPVPLPEPTETEVVERAYEHDAPAWVIVTVLPAIVSVALREVVEVFAAIEKVTVPFPDPELPPVTVIQPALLTAVQVHAVEAVTPTEPVPAVAATAVDVADSV